MMRIKTWQPRRALAQARGRQEDSSREYCNNKYDFVDKDNDNDDGDGGVAICEDDDREFHDECCR